MTDGLGNALQPTAAARRHQLHDDVGRPSTKEFLAYMAGAMPYGAAALDAETYATLTAYILRSNGASPGSQALSASTDVPIGSVTGQPQAP